MQGTSFTQKCFSLYSNSFKASSLKYLFKVSKAFPSALFRYFDKRYDNFQIFGGVRGNHGFVIKNILL